VLLATQAPTSGASLGGNVTAAAWKSKPSSYLVATRDRAIQPELERTMAKTIRARTIEVASSHVAMLSHPQETAHLIIEGCLPMNADALTTRVADGIASHYTGQRKANLFRCGDGGRANCGAGWLRRDPNIRAVVLTGGAPGYFARHFSITSLLQLAEPLRAFRSRVADNATYNAGFFDKAMALCESMPKPVIAAISGTCLAGAFEFALSCDLRIAEDGDYLIRIAGDQPGTRPRGRRHQRLAAHHRDGGCAHAHLMGDAVNTEGSSNGLALSTKA